MQLINWADALKIYFAEFSGGINSDNGQPYERNKNSPHDRTLCLKWGVSRKALLYFAHGFVYCYIATKGF